MLKFTMVTGKNNRFSVKSITLRTECLILTASLVHEFNNTKF